MSVVKSHHISSNVMYHTALITTLFNSGACTNTRLGRFLEKCFSLVVFLGMSFIALLAVFARSGIDTWIQFSLYIVPIISIICGHSIFKSSSFKKILNIENDPTDNENVFESLERQDEHYQEGGKLEGLERFLKIRSLKTCFYPVSLVLHQWSVYLIFFFVLGSSEFSGPFRISEHSSTLTRSMDLVLNKSLWLSLYITFWTVAMYVTGFVACCFLLVADIHKLDIKSFLCRMGNSPMLEKTPGYRSNGNSTTRVTNHGNYQPLNTPVRVLSPMGPCLRLLSLVTGFLTLGLLEFTHELPWKTHSIPAETGHHWDNIGASDSGVTEEWNSSYRSERGSSFASITPQKATKLFIHLMTDLEKNTSLFKPFLVLLTFFSVTNLVTHVVAMAALNIDGFTALHWWTLMRTLFWFLLAIRLLSSVATITNALSRVLPHIYYLRSIGELAGSKEEWEDFFRFADTFQLGSRTYGFPLTLNQVASIVAVVNFSFLIVLSLISKSEK